MPFKAAFISGFAQTSSASTWTVSAGSTVANGLTVIAVLYQSGVSITAISTPLNTYSLVATGPAQNGFVVAIYAKAAVTAESSPNLTITFSAATLGCVVGDNFSYSAGSGNSTQINGVVDQSGTASTATANLSVSTSAPDASNSQIVYAAFGGSSASAVPTFTAGGGYTASGSSTGVSGANNMYLYVEYLYTYAAGNNAQTATGTLSAAAGGASEVIASFKDQLAARIASIPSLPIVSTVGSIG